MSQEKLNSAKNLFFIALVIDIAVTALVAITDFWAVGVLNDIRSGVTTTDQSTISTLEFWGDFAKVIFLTTIGVGLALLRWLNACYRYAKETLMATGFAQEGWKTWGWIVPFMNLFKPYKVINEIYKVGAIDYLGGDEWKKSSGSGMLLFWWVFWVITHMVMWGIGKQALKSTFRDDLTLNQIIGMYYGNATVCVISLIVAALWFMVAGSLTRRLLSRSVPVVSSVAPAHVPAANESAVPAAKNFTKAAYPENLSAASLQTVVDEDRVYAEIAKELEDGVADKGLWTRLFAECDGDEKLIKVAYIKQRATKLKAGAMASALEVVRPIKIPLTEDHQKTVDVLAAKSLEQSASSEPVTPPDPRRLHLDKWKNSTIQDCINALFLKGGKLDTNFDGSFVVASPTREKHTFQNKQALQEFMASFSKSKWPGSN